MGWFQPTPPPFDLDEWRAKPYLSRLKPVCQDWAVNGFGTPHLIYFLYVFKLIIFSVGAFLLVSLTTPGIGGLGDIGDWWTQPIVFQKLAAWTMLWEVLGLGSRLDAPRLPLLASDRRLPLLAPSRHRPPPPLARPRAADRGLAALDPRRRPLRRRPRRRSSTCCSPGGDGGAPRQGPRSRVTLGLLGLLGLRDKVSFLAARPEVYGLMLVVSLFPLETLIVGWQLVFICIWWGAAASKLNHHFPYVISVMVSNTPWNRSRKMKAMLYRDWPDDVRPSRHAALGAHLGTVLEFGLPLRPAGQRRRHDRHLAVVGMVLFHVHITSTFALGVPLEWNLFMIFGLLFLFGHYGDVPLSTLDARCCSSHPRSSAS